MTRYLVIFASIVFMYSEHNVFAQHRTQISESYSISVGYTNMISASHGLSNTSNNFHKGIYIRYAFEYDKKLSPFMFVSYSRKSNHGITDIPQSINIPQNLWSATAGTIIRSKKWPFYNAFYAGIENMKVIYSYESYSLNRSSKNAVIATEIGLKYPMNSFISGDLSFGLRLPFNHNGLNTSWRLGIITDFSKR